ncbi:hypothetical protein KAR91_55945 [Candidatus Pacearchaeota archaeon]|nr:hypothetical protein [Candidatus Pacearchaeota archaeon]
MPSLIQELTVEKEPLDLANIYQSSFHESNILDCPQVVLHLFDRDSLIDLMGIKHGSSIKIYFSDIISDEFEEEMEFNVQSITPTGNENIKALNCLESSVFDSIQKQPKGIYFHKKSVSLILRQLFPKIVHFDIDEFPVLGDFHIPSGSQINKEIKDQLCRQYASMCWISRNKLYFKKITDLFNQEPIAKYTNDRTKADAYQIQKWFPVENKNKDRQISREYTGYHQENGFIQGGKIGMPKKVTDFDNKIILNNLAIGSKKVLDILVPGNGLIQPCKMIEFEWSSNNPEMPINESLPSKALATRLNHSMRGEEHSMRVGLSSIIQ